jgi:hypothetical protein
MITMARLLQQLRLPMIPMARLLLQLGIVMIKVATTELINDNGGKVTTTT